MTEQDWKLLQAHLALPQSTPLKAQNDLLRDDVLKLVTEVMRLRNERSLHASGWQDGQSRQQAESDAHAAGAENMRQACLEVACVQCTAAIIRLAARAPIN